MRYGPSTNICAIERNTSVPLQTSVGDESCRYDEHVDEVAERKIGVLWSLERKNQSTPASKDDRIQTPSSPSKVSRAIFYQHRGTVSCGLSSRWTTHPNRILPKTQNTAVKSDLRLECNQHCFINSPRTHAIAKKPN